MFQCPAAELADLVSELQEVNDWVTFGLHLKIKIWKLRAIEKECQTIGERRTRMLEEWQNNETPTWSAVVQALVGIGMRRLASDLAQTHGWFIVMIQNTYPDISCLLSVTAGVPPPKLSDNEFKPLEQVTNITQQEEVTM